MTTIKSYTDIEQSKKLAEILSIESADMCYIQDLLANCKYGDYKPYIGNPFPAYGQDKIRCWSVAALLNVLPKIGAEEPAVRKLYYASEPKERYICEYNIANITNEYDNPVDACVAMIEKLHELNLL